MIVNGNSCLCASAVNELKQTISISPPTEGISIFVGICAL